MNGVVQANLKPNTVKRIEAITDKPATRGFDKMINECLDKIKENKCNKKQNGESIVE